MNYLVSCFAYNFKRANKKEVEVKSFIEAIMLLPPVVLLGFIILNGFYQMYEMLF